MMQRLLITFEILSLSPSSDGDAKENLEKNMASRDPGSEKFDGLRGRGTGLFTISDHFLSLPAFNGIKKL